MSTSGAIHETGPINFETFYEKLKGKENPTLLSCLRIIRENSSQQSSPIETLAALVRDGKNSKTKAYQEFARKIADVAVRSKFFAEAERDVRDIFLEASSYTWHNLKTRISEWARMACNRIRYGHTSSKEIQKKLTAVATEAIFYAIEAAEKPENIISEFEKKFDGEAPNTKGTPLFKAAFLKELEASEDEYQGWWTERHPKPAEVEQQVAPPRPSTPKGRSLRLSETPVLREREASEAERHPKPAGVEHQVEPPRPSTSAWWEKVAAEAEEEEEPLVQRRKHYKKHELKSLQAERGKVQKRLEALSEFLTAKAPEEKLAEAWKDLRMAQRQLRAEERKLETAPQREERKGRLLTVEYSITQACSKAATVDDIPQQFKAFLTGILPGQPWVKNALERFNEDFVRNKAFYERQWSFYHPKLGKSDSP